MSTRWEDIVRAARELDQSFARGTVPEPALAGELARAVLEFQQHVLSLRQPPLKAPSARRSDPPPAPGDRRGTAAKVPRNADEPSSRDDEPYPAPGWVVLRSRVPPAGARQDDDE